MRYEETTQTVRMNTTNAVCPIGETTGKLIGLITLITAALVGYASYAAFMVFLYAGSLDWIRLDLSEVEKGMMFGLSPILKRSNAKPIHVNHLTIRGPYLGAPSSLPVHDHSVLVRPPPDNGPFVVQHIVDPMGCRGNGVGGTGPRHRLW